MYSKPVLLVGATLLAGSSLAIVRRHDRPDSAYLTERSAFPCVGRVSGFAEGTLIGTRWVLTASHVAMGLNPFNAYVELGGKRYAVKTVLFHPKGDMNREAAPIDMALLYLREPVAGIKPAILYAGNDEIGKVIRFVGAGMTGDGRAEPSQRDGKFRSAENVVDGADEREISFTFDSPPNGLPHEGISGPGDSGGPALLKVGRELYVLGVSARNSKNPGQGHCMYGTKEYYTRVSTQRDWIVRTMKGAEAPHWGWSTPTPNLQDPPKTDCIREFVQAFNSGNREHLEAFGQKWRTAASLARMTPDQRWAAMKGLIDANGKLTPVRYAKSRPGSIAVQFQAEKGGGGLALEFLFTQEGAAGGQWTGPDGKTTPMAGGKGIKLLGFTVVPI